MTTASRSKADGHPSVENGSACMRHLAARYGWLAAALGLAALLAIQRGMVRGHAWHTITVLVLWCTAAAVLLHLAYTENDPACFAKRPDGRLPVWARVVMLPYFLPLWMRQLVLTRFSREPASTLLAPGVHIGRRPSRPREIPEGTTTIVDLAAECAAPAVVRHHAGVYVSFPILEAGVRSAADVSACLDALPEHGVFIHCAQGHGRTGFFSCALLLHRGLAQTLPEAQALLTAVRPRARLRQAQVGFLERHAAAISTRPKPVPAVPDAST